MNTITLEQAILIGLSGNLWVEGAYLGSHLPVWGEFDSNTTTSFRTRVSVMNSRARVYRAEQYPEGIAQLIESKPPEKGHGSWWYRLTVPFEDAVRATSVQGEREKGAPVFPADGHRGIVAELTMDELKVLVSNGEITQARIEALEATGGPGGVEGAQEPPSRCGTLPQEPGGHSGESSRLPKPPTSQAMSILGKAGGLASGRVRAAKSKTGPGGVPWTEYNKTRKKKGQGVLQV